MYPKIERDYEWTDLKTVQLRTTRLMHELILYENCVADECTELRNTRLMSAMIWELRGLISVTSELDEWTDLGTMRLVRESKCSGLRTVHIVMELSDNVTRWGSVTFWCGSGSAVSTPPLWLADPDPPPDPTPFFSDLKDVRKKKNFLIFFSYNSPAGILSSILKI